MFKDFLAFKTLINNPYFIKKFNLRFTIFLSKIVSKIIHIMFYWLLLHHRSLTFYQ